MKRYIRNSKTITSGCSFDFAHDGYYTKDDIDTVVSLACDASGIELLGTDYREVDYSQYHEYDDVVVSQCGFDFAWNEDAPYIERVVRKKLEDGLASIGYELVGIDFYSI